MAKIIEKEAKQQKEPKILKTIPPQETSKTSDAEIVEQPSLPAHDDQIETNNTSSTPTVINPIDQLTKPRKLTAQNLEAQRKALVQKAINTQLESDIEEIKTKIFTKQSDAENKANYGKARVERLNYLRKERSHRDRFNRIFNWFKVITLALLVIVLIVASIIGLYRFYRWATEEPLIKEIERKVEVEKIIEKEVEVEKIVEKEVIPEECTQIRRNGKIFVSCDGVTIDGAPTISESGIQDIPELVTD